MVHHHLTDIATMYASRAAEAGLVIRNETTNYIPELQIKNEIHKDTINALVVRLEKFVSVHILCIVFSLVHSEFIFYFPTLFSI